jgi:uncharacterized protein YcbK (DUF882 family)
VSFLHCLRGLGAQQTGKETGAPYELAERWATKTMSNNLMTRRTLLRAFAATTIAAAPVMANATGLLRGAGDIRRIRMYNGRAGESLDMIYWIEGEYIRPALEEINYFFRDWRDNTQHSIDARTIDILTASHRLMETDEPYTLLSGYRSPATNAMLRSRSSGVARNSRHLVGEAADVQLQSRSVGQMYQAARACNAGGVGRYSRSNFVHMDCGPVRSWGG